MQILLAFQYFPKKNPNLSLCSLQSHPDCQLPQYAPGNAKRRLDFSSCPTKEKLSLYIKYLLGGEIVRLISK
jgi:hypothetical protein